MNEQKINQLRALIASWLQFSDYDFEVTNEYVKVIFFCNFSTLIDAYFVRQLRKLNLEIKAIKNQFLVELCENFAENDLKRINFLRFSKNNDGRIQIEVTRKDLPNVIKFYDFCRVSCQVALYIAPAD